MTHIPFTADLRCLSDWHIGTGMGRQGDVDRVTRRDERDVPVVPAKTLTGMWRDALERLVHGLTGDGGDPGWGNWVNVLFGSQPSRGDSGPPRPAALELRAARLEGRTAERLARRPGAVDPLIEHRRALTLTRPGVALDYATGAARANQLRFVELARAGLLLRASGAVSLPEGTDPLHVQAALALLLSSAALVDRIGGKRRRGAGRCVLQPNGLGDAAEAVAFLRKHAAAAPGAPPAPRQPTARRAVSQSVGGAYVTLDLELLALGPLVVGGRLTGNVTRSSDHVPGSTVLAAVSRILHPILGDQWPDAVVAGDVVCTAATPTDQHGHPGLRTPAVLAAPKMPTPDAQPAIVNRLRAPVPPGGQPLTALRGGFLTEAGVRPAASESSFNAHATIDEEQQRPTSAIGGLFSYEALAANTRLGGQLRLRAALDARLRSVDERWWERLHTSVRLGRSKKDDYGRAELRPLGAPASPPVDAQLRDGRLVVWVAADVLLRDERLRPTAEPAVTARAVARRLWPEADPEAVELEIAAADDRLLATVAYAGRTDSWHAGWSLPRPTLAGLGAGSVLVLRVPAGWTLDHTRVHELIAGGLGERRAEGFGQVRIDPPALRTAQLGDEAPATDGMTAGWTEPASDPLAAQAAEPSDELAVRLDRLVLEGLIRRRADARAATIARELRWARGEPGSSQLGALRTALARGSGGNHAAARAWFVGVQRAARRQKAWGTERLRLLEALLGPPSEESVADHPVWKLLALDSGSLQTATALSGETAQLALACWGDAVTHAVAAAARRAPRTGGD